MTFHAPLTRAVPALIVPLMVAVGLAADNSAQDNRRLTIEDQHVDPFGRKLETFSPRSGPPGTVVTVRGVEMPPLAPLRLGVGALRIGFEEVGWILSSLEGEFTFDIVIPEWARHDVAHLFIVFDPYFHPIRLSEVFHVTDREGRVQRQGRIERREPGCPTLNGADRIPYVLIGDVRGFADEEVVVEGKIAERSTCGERTAIEILSIRSAG